MNFHTIMAYEQGELSESEVIDLFQDLLNSGDLKYLQGSYMRTAMDLVQAGLCSLPRRDDVNS